MREGFCPHSSLPCVPQLCLYKAVCLLRSFSQCSVRFSQSVSAGGSQTTVQVLNPSLSPQHTCFNNVWLIPVSLELGRAREGGSPIPLRILAQTKASAVGSGTKSLALSRPFQLRASWWRGRSALWGTEGEISFSFVVCTMEKLLKSLKNTHSPGVLYFYLKFVHFVISVSCGIWY